MDLIRSRSFIDWPCGSIFLAFWIAVFLWGHQSMPQAADRIITASATELSRVAGVAKIIMGQAYRALGYKLKVTCLPGKRALYKANQGQTDAELVRIQSIGKLYPNLVQVPEAIFKVRGMAFVWNKDLAIRGPRDLRGHKVGIVRGIRWAAEMSKGLSPTIAYTAHDLFKRLAQRQIDIALEAHFTGHAVMKSFSGNAIIMVEKPLIEIPVYHFVHKKNRHLIEPLNKEIDRMKRYGVIDEIIYDLLNEPALNMC